MLKQCFLSTSSTYSMENHLEIDCTPVAIPCNGNHGERSLSMELSSLVYTPEKFTCYINIQRSPTLTSVSQISSINGTRRQDFQSRTGPANSTFINVPQSCVHTLDLDVEVDTISDQDLKQSCHRFSDVTSSSGYSSKTEVQKSISEFDNQRVSARIQYTDSGFLDCNLIRLRPDCIGQESPQDGDQNKQELKKYMRSEDSDGSLFMDTPLCRPGLITTKSKSSYKSISKKLKQFRKQFHHLNKSTDCSLDILAVL